MLAFGGISSLAILAALAGFVAFVSSRQALAAEGGTPVIADLNLDAADATAREIKAKGSDAFAVGMNFADEAAVEKGVADTMAKYGRINLLVSNAGIQIVKPIVDFPQPWSKYRKRFRYSGGSSEGLAR